MPSCILFRKGCALTSLAVFPNLARGEFFIPNAESPSQTWDRIAGYRGKLLTLSLDPAMCPRCVCGLLRCVSSLDSQCRRALFPATLRCTGTEFGAKFKKWKTQYTYSNLTDYSTVWNKYTPPLSLVVCPVFCMQFYIIKTVLSAWKLEIVHSNQKVSLYIKSAFRPARKR